MKIGVNTLFLIPGAVGGSETYLLSTLKAILQKHRNLSFVLFTNCENDVFFQHALRDYGTVKFVNLKVKAVCRPARILYEQFILPSYVRKSLVDILWSPGYTAPCRSPVPQVLTLHDMQYRTHPEDMTFFYRLATHLLVNLSVRNSTKIIAISKFSKDEIVKYTNADESKIDAIYHGVDTAFFNRIDDVTRRQVDKILGGHKRYILAVSHTYPHKRMEALASAFVELENKLPHSLVHVGNPRLGEKKLERSLYGLKDKNRYIRLRGLNFSDLVALYQCSDMFIHPSAYEGFGLPVLEAMAAGIPVIASRKASIPEIGKDAVVYLDEATPLEIVAKIREVIDWPVEERRTRVKHAREIAATFTWERTAAQTVESFQKCI